MKKNGIARMVAGGAAGGFEDDERMSDEQAAGLSSAAESAVGGVLANLRDEAPAAKPAARMSDRKAADLAGRAERAVGGVVANLRGQPPRMSDSRAAELSAQADRAVGGVLANLRGTPAPAPARGIARAALADMSGKAITGAERAAAMAPAPVRVDAPVYTPGQYSSPYMRANYAPAASMAYPAPGYEEDFMAAYPSAVMSYPNRTVGYQYAAGAPVTPYMSPVSSRPVPQGAIMSMVRRSR